MKILQGRNKDIVEDLVFCKIPWIGMQAEQTGEYFPCCIYRHKLGDVNKQSWREVWNSESYRNFRKNIFNWDPATLEGCKACTMYEEWGMSQRQYFNCSFPQVSDKDIEDSAKRSYTMDEKLYFLDVRFSNKCNLQCVMCGSHASSRWEEVKGKHPDRVSPEGLRNQVQMVLDNLDTLQEIRFAGGEPTFFKEHIEILQEFLNRGKTGIKLIYNTNLTNRYYKKIDIFDLWNKFEQVEVTVSLDGGKNCDEYVRWGSNFNSVVQNIKDLKKIAPGVQILVHPTVSVFNILRLADLSRELELEGLGDVLIHYGNVLLGPREFDVRNLPKVIRTELQEKVRAYKGTKYWFIYEPLDRELDKDFVSQEESLFLFRKLKQSIEELDTRRGTNFFEVNPEFKEWFQKII